MTVDQLAAAVERLREIAPTAELVRNTAGNLAVFVDGSYLGHVDLVTGRVDIWRGPSSRGRRSPCR